MEETKKQITDYSIWEVLGLDLTEQDKEDMVEDFINAAWMDLIENGLREKLGEAEYTKLYTSLKLQNLDSDEFVQAIKDKLMALSINVDDELNKCMCKVLKEFIEDQVNYLEKRVKSIKEQTERDVKLSLIQSLRDLFTQEQWDQMGVIFKKIDSYQLQEGLVLHL